MPLNTVAEYITAARTLLQDTNVVARYSDAEMAEALGFAILEARRMRPELFNTIAGGFVLPDIGRATATSTAVAIEPMYRLAFVYGLVSHVMLREEEESAQGTARAFAQQFVMKLLSVAA